MKFVEGRSNFPTVEKFTAPTNSREVQEIENSSSFISIGSVSRTLVSSYNLTGNYLINVSIKKKTASKQQWDEVR